ncbi:MAG TPA: hypothetical protein VGQ99_04265 [Tepidisphaeraceae bacterium]|jgi:hypothetical protein|nr:hypothetical protein [Tepidisphaeraceae bacterium]
MRFRLWHLSLIFSLCGLAQAAETDYEIRIHRPDKAGMKFDVAITSAVKREVVTTADGRATRDPEQVVAIELKAVAEIVEVDEKGRDLKVTYVVEKCVKAAGEKDEEVLPKGKIFTAAIGPDGKRTVYAAADGKLTDEQIEALDLVADLPAPDAALADELYGPKGRQKIGDTWSVNAGAMAEDLKRHDYQVKPDAISGSLKLNGREKANGVQCLNITGETKVQRAKMKAADEANAPISIRNVTMESTFSWLLPVDSSLNHVVAYGTVVSTYSMGVNGGDFKRELKTTRMYEIRAVPLP